jgi:hypothetical protein
MAAAPVADGGAADAGEPRDLRGGDLCPVVLHAPGSPRTWWCDVEHTDGRKIYPFTS